jgi:hypothetical protein
LADNISMTFEHPTRQELARDLLARMMSDLSEDCWRAAWMNDLEFVLWDALRTGKASSGLVGISERDIARLKGLHEAAGGWWIWPKGEGAMRFVTTEEWLPIFSNQVNN